MTTADNTSDVLWACVEKGFHVGSRRGEFLGYVDLQRDGRYRAFNACGADVGAFASLQEATAAVVAADDAMTAPGAAAPREQAGLVP